MMRNRDLTLFKSRHTNQQVSCMSAPAHKRSFKVQITHYKIPYLPLTNLTNGYLLCNCRKTNVSEDEV